MPEAIDLRVNGKKQRIQADAARPLLSILRDDLDLTAAKFGCGEGQCGACTVLVDGNPLRSCRTPVGSVSGKEILTVEGLEQNGKLHPLQEAFLKTEAMQCGYCTCGMIMSGIALLRRNPDPSEAEIVRFMEGNLCRCGTYPRIKEAISCAAHAMKSGKVTKSGKKEARR